MEITKEIIYLLITGINLLIVFIAYQLNKFRKLLLKESLEKRLKEIKEEQVLHLKWMEPEAVSPTYIELFDNLVALLQRTIIPLAVTNKEIRRLSKRLMNELAIMSQVIRYPTLVSSKKGTESIRLMCDRFLADLNRNAQIQSADNFWCSLVLRESLPRLESPDESVARHPQLVVARLVVEGIESEIADACIGFETESSEIKESTYKALLLKAGYTEAQLACMTASMPIEQHEAVFQEEYETILQDL